MIVAGEEVARFVSERLGFGLCPPYVAIGIQHREIIVGGVILNHFEGADVHVSVAGTGWTRGFLHALGVYVFEKLGCQRATIVTEQAKVVDLGLRLGGQIEGCLRNHFGYERDATIVGILKRDYAYATPRR